MSEKLSSHDHGNCELCDEIEAKLEAMERWARAAPNFRNSETTKNAVALARAQKKVLAFGYSIAAAQEKQKLVPPLTNWTDDPEGRAGDQGD